MKKFIFIFFLVLPFSKIYSSDWPIYKGNFYFTANNDQIIVKNNNLKWLFMASNYIFNPVVSEGRVYFTDIDKIVYCVEEDTGKLLWKINLMEISPRFLSKGTVAGKVKYPLIKGNFLFVSDSIAIYCIDKRNGKIIWARVGLQEAEKINPVVDGIYADPIISGNAIYYGTRKNFIAREIFNGHIIWSNSEIESFSGFPTFYDDKIFAQSKDLKKNQFFVYCLEQFTGKSLWKKQIENPLQIFSPVVYQGKVYIPSGKKLYCLSLKDGSEIFQREYEDFITSNPSFTDQEILFTIGNRKLSVVSPDNGSVKYSIEFGERTSPYFATVNDQIYVAHNYTKKVGEKDIVFTVLKAYSFGDRKILWEFYPPFPGGASQPAVSRGTLFLPAGNYIYAVGTYYERPIVYGNDGRYRLAPEDGSSETLALSNKKVSDEKVAIQKLASSVKSKAQWDDEMEKELTAGVFSSEKRSKSSRGPSISEKQTSSKEDSSMKLDIKEPEIGETLRKVPQSVVLPEIKLEDIEVGKSIVVENIYFEFDRAYLRRESIKTLDSIVAQLKKNPRIKLEIHGHTDNIGTKEYNQKLSEKRANAVMEYLIKNGISPERLKAIGFGEAKPIADNSTEEGRSRNRRTEFLIVEK